MKGNMANLTLLGVFLLGTIGIGAQAPGQDPAAEGQWGPVLNWPIQAIHMVVLKNGKVLSFQLPSGLNPNTPCILFDPVSEMVTAEFDGPADPNRHRLVSSGHAALADGKIFFTGSWETVPTTTLYDPDVDPPGPAS